jgi:hypothetical protein
MAKGYDNADAMAMMAPGTWQGHAQHNNQNDDTMYYNALQMASGLGRRQGNKQGQASAKGNAVASLAKGVKVVRKGDLTMKKNYDKTAPWRTRKIC